jgi:serine/threonine-protein kinase
MDRDGKGGFDDTVDSAGSDAPTLATSGVPASSPPEIPVVAGELLSTRYRLGAVIGRGGMGEIVSAHDDQIGRSVAIKRLRALDPPTEAVARFRREAQIQGRLEHPAVVPVHELWHDAQGRPFFVMKQLAGTTLADVLSKLAVGDRATIDTFSRQRLLRAFAEICLAVEFAHTRGVIHRDLKPANIILGDFGEVFVLDWGVAHVDSDAGRTSFADIDTIEGGTVAGTMLGTPGYMSPEQLRGEVDLDGRSDVYALGCILFEILALEPLHARGHAGLATTLGGVEARPSVRVPERDTPPELDAICLAATTVDRDDRHASARSLGDAVQRFLDGDRDLALRKELAQHELATARAALERGRGPDERLVGSRAAVRALALDPTDRAAAELVGRLMLEPPAETPHEVDDAMEALEHDAIYAGRRLMTMTAAVIAGFFPIMFWVGFRDAWYLIVGVGLVGVMGACAFLATRRNILVTARVALVAYVLMIALFSRILTPFLVAPSMAVLTVMSMGTYPKVVRLWLLVVLMLAAVLGPWFLELSGVVSETTAIAGDRIVLHPIATTVDPVVTMIGLTLYVLFMISIGGIVAFSLSNARREAQRVVQMQSWQLQQLVPQATTSV